jgi:transposase
LLARRRQLLVMSTMEKNRVQIMPKSLRADIQRHIRHLENTGREAGQAARSEDRGGRPMAGQACHYAQQARDWAGRRQYPAGGFAGALLVDHKQVAALTDVAPYSRIRGGRHSVRTILFMATLTSVQHKPVIKRFHQRLVSLGKHDKVALTACIREMVIMLNAMVRDGKPWNKKLAQ